MFQQVGTFARVKPYRLRSFFTIQYGAILRAWEAAGEDRRRRASCMFSTGSDTVNSRPHPALPTCANASSANTAAPRILRHARAFPSRSATSLSTSSRRDSLTAAINPAATATVPPALSEARRNRCKKASAGEVLPRVFTMLTLNDRVGFNRRDVTGNPAGWASVTFPQAAQTVCQ